jgi:hypothetical protein
MLGINKTDPSRRQKVLVVDDYMESIDLQTNRIKSNRFGNC